MSTGQAISIARAHVGEITALLTAASAIVGLGSTITRYVRSHLKRKPLQPLVRDEKYLSQVVQQATTNYIAPDCQSIDPSGQEDFRKVIAAKQPAFSVLDEIFTKDVEEKFTILLADTGMGKTSLLLNYYSRHLRKRKQRFRIALIPLGQRTASEQIRSVSNQDETALLLDALDEDPLAIQNHRNRLDELTELTSPFRTVLITCRTQFFARDEEIPRETGVIRHGVTKGGQNKAYSFRKLYLSPFSDRQVKRFILRAFPIWRWGRRRKAKAIVARMPDLTVRPMLLAHVEDLIRAEKPILTSADLYGQMVKAWLDREKHFVSPEKLTEFPELLAADIYMNRQERGSERIPRSEAEALSKEAQIDLAGWQIAGRSLLNRDGAGNLKFAHRSFMEYLFIRYFIKHPKAIGATEWTDQMKVFWWEALYLSSDVRSGERMIIWGHEVINADRVGLDRLRLRPLIELPTTPQQMKPEEILNHILSFKHNGNFSPMCRPWPELYVAVRGPDVRQDSGSLGDTKLVCDIATGLMWQARSREAASFDDASEYVNELRESNWAGYGDWRIPTVAEALSLLPMDAEGIPDARQLAFEDLSRIVWTSDKCARSGGRWRIEIGSRPLLDLRRIQSLESLRGSANIRAVRTHRTNAEL
jgi:hypothetical protein